MAKWIIDLPAGIYSVKDIQTITGVRCHNSIKKTMLRWGATLIQRKCEHSNLMRNFFDWSGYKLKNINDII